MKKYQIIYADPPWQLKYLKETKIGINVYDLPYSVMNNDSIKNLPVKELTDRDALLFLWCVDSKLPILFDIMNAWGFKYITVGFVWNKVAKTTRGVNATLGKYTRKSYEFCYIGGKGRYIATGCSVDQYIGIPKGRHSEKPLDIKNRIVKMCGDLPRIELFAREKTDGWDVWGNEVKSNINLEGGEKHE